MVPVPGNLAGFAMFTFVTKLHKLERWFDEKFSNKKITLKSAIAYFKNAD